MTQIARQTLPVSLEQEMRKSYLDYAMSVIVGRALPDVRDGLKPVHRRVLYAMHVLNNDWNRPYKKSARIVGDVIGKYHPHGDSAVYDTIVRMAQPFSLRYCLVDGQGNFGSVDGDNAAAMRYTEIRLSKIAHELLNDLDKETVDFGPNYDGSEIEPFVLPARIPNLLINGSSGIAVGMATNIPPHNICEVIRGCLKVLDNPDVSIDELIEVIPAPDFPTAGIIYGTNGVRQGYKTGRGKVIMRAKTHFEPLERKSREAIIIDELPFQVNKRSLLERIAELVTDKKVEGISDIRDESDKSGMRVVIELKRGEVPEVVLNNLYKTTQLQDTFGMNFVALIEGQPKTLNLKEILVAFLSHRREVITRRTVFELNKAREKAFLLEGLAVAVSNLDDIVNLIKSSPSPVIAKDELLAKVWDPGVVRDMLLRAVKSTVIEAFRPIDVPPGCGLNDEGYKLSERQATEILQMRLQRLTGLEQEKIVNDFKEVIEKISDLLDILAKPQRISGLIRGDFEKINNDYKDQRKSIIEENVEELQTEDLITPQDVVVTFSNTGYVKSQPISEYSSQRRGGRGKLAASTKENDWIERILIANTHNTLLGFTSRGRVYWMRVWEVPQGSRSSRGRPIVNFWPLVDGEKVTAVLPVKSFDENQFVFMATSFGTVKKTPLSKFARPMKRGIIAAALDDGDTLIGATITDGNQDIMLFSTAGKAVRYAESDVRPMGRGSRGVRGMFLEKGQCLVSMLSVPNCSQENSSFKERTVFIATQNGFGKRTSLSEFTRYSRGTKGMICIKTSVRNGLVVGACLVSSSDELMLIANNGVLVRFKVEEVSEMGRSTQGVRLISLDDGSLLTGFESFSEPELENKSDLDEKDNIEN